MEPVPERGVLEKSSQGAPTRTLSRSLGPGNGRVPERTLSRALIDVVRSARRRSFNGVVGPDMRPSLAGGRHL